MLRPRCCLALSLLAAACSDDTAPSPDQGGPRPEASIVDKALADTAKTDGVKPDGAKVDGAAKPDGAKVDGAAKPDSAKIDGATGACNALVNTAPIHQEENASGAPPTLTGGTIVEGKYHRTKTVYYGGNKNRYIQETIQLSKLMGGGLKMEFVNATSNTTPPAPQNHVNVELTPTTGAGVTYKIVCGTSGSLTTSYQATATTFTLRLGPDLIYTLQP
jgi:hypothetical protein